MPDSAIQTRLNKYKRLLEISREIAATLELEELLSRIVFAASELTDSAAASILLYDQSRQQLYFQSSTNLDTPVMRGLVVPVEQSIAGWIVVNKQPMIVNDAKSDPRIYEKIGEKTQYPTSSLLGVPMLTQGKTVGVLEVLNKNAGLFTTDDQEILMTLGTQAAVAIENTRLFQQSDLISEMIHEFRTPLSSINAATHLLLRKDISTIQRKKMITLIQSETERLSNLTSSFLDLARLESGRMQFQVVEFDLVIMFGEIVGLIRAEIAEKDLQFNWNVSDSLPLFKGDHDKIKQVVLNLLSNAIKYNRPEGSVTLSADALDGQLIIRVSDTGPGIPPESMPHMFEKFYRVPGTEKIALGTGLGLSICKKIVEAHGGKIEVESTLGEGTTFTVRFPLQGR